MHTLLIIKRKKVKYLSNKVYIKHKSPKSNRLHCAEIHEINHIYIEDKDCQSLYLKRQKSNEIIK